MTSFHLFNVDIFQLFTRLAILCADFDSENIHKNRPLQSYSLLMQFELFFFTVRQFISAFYTDNLKIAFYLSNVSFGEGSVISQIHMLSISLYAWYSLCVLRCCYSLHRNKENRYWLHWLWKPGFHIRSSLICPIKWTNLIITCLIIEKRKKYSIV